MLLLAAALLLTAAALPPAAPFHPSSAFTPAGPVTARGAFVWLHGGYDSDEFPHGPPEPGWVRRLAARGYDVWRFDRPDGDPLQGSGEALLRGLHSLRDGGYRRIVVGGQSRGAFVSLIVLREPSLVDGLALLSPAAHGTDPALWPVAMQTFHDRMDAARPAPLHVAYVTLADDPFDQDPEARITALRAMAAHTGMKLLVIDRPPGPRGHMGSYDPEFDAHFGACLAAFLDGAPAACG